MASPLWVTMEKVSGGNKQPDTGLTITIRDAPYAVDDYTLAEIGTTGVYINKTVAGGLYKIYKGGVEQTDYGIIKHTDEDEEQYLLTAGTRALTGDLSMGNNQLTDLGDPFSSTDAISWSYANSLYISKSSRTLYATNNVLIVDYDTTDISAYRYNTIQEAIDYAAGTGSAGATNRWTIYVYPHKNNSSFSGYVENLTLKKYIDLIGVGMVLVKGTVAVSGTWTGGTFARIQNFVFDIEDTSYTARGQEFNNVQFLVLEDIGSPTIATENSQFYNCGFWQRGVAITTLITSAGDNVFIGCYANDDVTAMIGSDKQIGFQMLDDVNAYYKIT